ncbi:unnamed protein product (macronuclear) [Paramecium tetraurelia]|uniref:Uncharacterized protein n=1 Tax=Paramecium tetraurelia TaxID=5888 RepID=A0D755_PARTE|nr:uncharacterized protein GSPATT00001913001 [Paramecium tetraurelia]CAK78872.1 unnamed protein product [Paramecium tetraurelia]|eukprot:XP_001446269.1 hypothetical protein (macronuclear) [Paramecium tetraurelia strain d4-2]
MDLFDQFQRFKTTLKTQIEHRPHSQQRNTVLKTKFNQSTLQTQQQQQVQDVQRKKTLQHHRSSTLFSAAKENQDKVQKQQQQQQRFTMVHKQLPEVLPICPIFQLIVVRVKQTRYQPNMSKSQLNYQALLCIK